MRSADALRLAPEATDFATPFSAALLSPAALTPTFLTGPHGKQANKRYDVYRNNVTVSLIAAISSIFPAVERITGPDFFRAMARFHVQQTPPNSPLLFDYGREFPDFIDGYEYAADMPWLSDVARIERLWLDSYHAADAPALSPAAFSALPPEALGDLTLTRHPATRLISSVHPAVTIFAMNRGKGAVSRVENRPEDGLITRIDDEVTVHLLAPGQAPFLRALLAGHSLANAVALAFDAEPSFDLSSAIGEMLSAGAFCELKMGTSNVEHA